MTPHSLPTVLAQSPIGKVTSYLHCAYISVSKSAPHTCIFNLRKGTPSQNGDDVILRGEIPLFSPLPLLGLRCRHSYGSTQQNRTTNAPDFGPEETHENLKQMESWWGLGEQGAWESDPMMSFMGFWAHPQAAHVWIWSYSAKVLVTLLTDGTHVSDWPLSYAHGIDPNSTAEAVKTKTLIRM